MSARALPTTSKISKPATARLGSSLGRADANAGFRLTRRLPSAKWGEADTIEIFQHFDSQIATQVAAVAIGAGGERAVGRFLLYVAGSRD